MSTAQDILAYWFQEMDPADWWQKNPDVDAYINNEFLAVHKKATAGELFEWRSTPQGRLAEIIILDQFSRHLFREHGLAFQYDAMALTLSQEAVRLKLDNELTTKEKLFLYLPYMHSESAVIHEQAMILFSQPGLEENLEYEIMHKKIIDRFGRYPHRNEALGRHSSDEEIAFLKTPNSSF